MKAVASLCCLFILATHAIAQKNSILKAESSSPFVLGVTDVIQSKELAEKRKINIYFPEGYSLVDTTRYPVIYLLDGGADEDFIHIAGLVQFNTFSWINHIPKSIVVGIVNVDRKRDLSYPTKIEADKKKYPTAGGSQKFMSFIEKELQPYIEQKYKGGGSRTIIGESLGGLMATEILFKKPELFDKYIIVSPSIWWDNGSLLDATPDILNANFTRNIDIYIAVGKEGLTPGGIPRVMEVDANLLADKINGTASKTVHAYLDYLPAEDHATIGHQAVFNAFRMLYPAAKK